MPWYRFFQRLTDIGLMPSMVARFVAVPADLMAFVNPFIVVSDLNTIKLSLRLNLLSSLRRIFKFKQKAYSSNHERENRT